MAIYPSAWRTPLSFGTGAVNGPTVLTGHGPVLVRMELADKVALSGVISVPDGVTINAGTALFTVATKYRPSVSRGGAVRTAGNTSTHARWTVSAAGVFSLSTALIGAAGQGADCPLDDIFWHK